MSGAVFQFSRFLIYKVATITKQMKLLFCHAGYLQENLVGNSAIEVLQRGIIIIPKSTRKERMEQNFQLFDFTLTESEMQEILKLDTGHSFVMPSHHDSEVTKMFMGFAPRKGK